MKQILILTTLLCLSGCATVFSGFNDDITFTSDPEGAVVYVDHERVGITPVVVSVGKDLSNNDIKFKKKGCATDQMALVRRFNRLTILNLTAWPGWLIDLMTGAFKTPRYTTYHSDLECPIIELDTVPYESNQFYM